MTATLTAPAAPTYVGRRRAATTTDPQAAPITPAEVVLPGTARQLVNTYDNQGNFLFQTSHRGTERQARAKGLLRITHDTDPTYATIVAAFLGTV